MVGRFLLVLFAAIAASCGSSPATPSGSQHEGVDPALIAYYAGNGDDLERHRIEELTHLIWCFAHLEGDSMRLFPSSEEFQKARERTITTMIGFKQRNPALKVLISFGGWGGCATCSEVFSREEGRRAFAISARRILERTQADGIDLDWEYPAVEGPPGHAWSPDDRGHFTLLIQELRKVLGERYEISFAVGAPDECLIDGFDWPRVMPVVDRVHVMSYDLVHGYSTVTGHHTALWSAGGQVLSAEHALQVLDSLGVPRSKVVIGSAFYGRIWKHVAPVNHGLFQPGAFDRTIPHSAMDTIITAANGWRWFRDSAANAAYACNARDSLFLTCDDTASVRAKARYVREQGLGGIMFWQLRDDKSEGGLLDALFDALRAGQDARTGEIR